MIDFSLGVLVAAFCLRGMTKHGRGTQGKQGKHGVRLGFDTPDFSCGHGIGKKILGTFYTGKKVGRINTG